MFKRLLIAGVVLVALSTLAGCGGNGTRVGTITKKEYEAAWTEHWTYMQPHTQCYGYGKTQSCSTYYMYIPMTTYHPDHWDFKLELCTDGDAIHDRSCKHGEVAVDETTFHQYKEGYYYGPK